MLIQSNQRSASHDSEFDNNQLVNISIESDRSGLNKSSLQQPTKGILKRVLQPAGAESNISITDENLQ